MAPANGEIATEPCADPLEPVNVLQLKLSRTAKSGFKGVTKTVGKHWQARITHAGKSHHVHSSLDPRHCAIMLALLERKAGLELENEPSLEELLDMGEEKWKEDRRRQQRAHVAWMASTRAAVAKL
tara:strand:- start:163 stop:540 length:378 start_codon:yes stop_codon:yes gene_type:complete